MFLLRPDIAADLVHAGLAHRDGEIAGLPLETPSDLLILIDPAGGVRFDEADRFRDRKVCLSFTSRWAWSGMPPISSRILR